MSEFVTNAWYVGAWADEVGQDSLLARRILDVPVVFFRNGDGAPAALMDRCPHKLAPLSLGKKVGGGVQCGYHGLQFDCHGQCLKIPTQSRIPPAAHVRAFPVIERWGALWIWMGDAALADDGKLVCIEHYDDPDWGLVSGQYLRFDCNYLNITDNLVDPAHTTFVHESTIGSPDGTDVPVQVEQGEDYVLAWRWIKNVPPVPLARKMGFGSEQTDRFQYYWLHLPSVSCVEFGTMQTGLAPTEENKNAGLRSFSWNFLTPETPQRTHYFWLHLRNYKVGDAQADKEVQALMTTTFQEDMQLLAAIQLQQNEFGVREYTKIAIDNAPDRVRRRIGQRIREEQAEQQPEDALA